MAPSEAEMVTALRAEADHCYRWENKPGAVYPTHNHRYRKILYVIEGSITFTPAGEAPVAMRPGDRIVLAPGTAHGAVVGDTGVVCWEGQAKTR
jgi:quercetin dioxygenase-like cupin family protein